MEARICDVSQSESCVETIRWEVHLAQNKLQSNANKTASNSTAIWNLLLGVFFQFQTTFKLAFNRPKSLQVTEVRCPQKIHSGANFTFIFKLLKDFVSIGKARQESKVFARFRENFVQKVPR